LKLTWDKVEKIIIENFNAIYYGLEPDGESKITPEQAEMISIFLQNESLKLSKELEKDYAKLGLLKKGYTLRKRKVRKRVVEEYGLYDASEKKIDQICLEEDDELAELYSEIQELETAIKGKQEFIKQIGYFSKKWELIIPHIKREFFTE